MSNMKRCQLFTLATLFMVSMFAMSTSAIAQEKDAGKKKEERKTHEVKSGYFEVVETISATVESRNMTEVYAKTDNWTDLEIQKIVDEGSTVSSGDEIVWFKTEDIDKKLKESRYALALGEISLRTSALEFDLAENTFALDNRMMEEKQQHLEEDFKYYTEIQRPNSEKNARRSVMNSEHALEYAQEEFNQLSRMYSEDELTEESEEIVLKRTQRDVENRQFYLEQTQIRIARQLDIELPREAEQKKVALERARLEYEKAKIEMPLNRDKKSIALDKARLALENQKEDFRELEFDRQRMTIKAPVDGLLYFGRCVRGKWMGPAGPNRDLREGKKAAPNKILVTIVDPNQLFLRADLNEKQLAGIKIGSGGVVTPKAFPQTKVRAAVSKISYVPVQEDKFDCQLDPDSIPQGLMPGMTCSVRFTLVQKDDAISVPADAVFSNDGINHFVYVVDGEGQRKQEVSVGLKSEKNIEITSGLSAGDEILTERPE